MNQYSQKDNLVKVRYPRPHQLEAIENGEEYFAIHNNGKLISPCGSGKTLTAIWLVQKLNAKNIIIAQPNLTLESQTLREWIHELLLSLNNYRFLCVCHDKSAAGEIRNGLHIDATTQEDEIVDYLKVANGKNTVLLTSYQSGVVTAKASKIAKFKWDIGLFDEAHKTTGKRDKLFSHLLYQKNIDINKKIFMTATPRFFTGNNDNIASMNDEKIYGKRFYELSMSKAIENGVLSDYKIITIASSQKEVEQFVKDNSKVIDEKWFIKGEEMHMIAVALSTIKAYKNYKIKKGISYHSSIKRAKGFAKLIEMISEKLKVKINTFHVNGNDMTVDERNGELNKFRNNADQSLLTNSKALIEGIDIPEADSIIYADDKKSTIDIVQSTGRVLRIHESKKMAYVIIPSFLKPIDKEKDFYNSDTYNDIRMIIRGLSTSDDRIIAYFREMWDKKFSKKMKIEYDFGEIKIDTSEFVRDIEIKIWEKTARIAWRPFNEIKKIIQTEYDINNAEDYFRARNTFPPDFPSNPPETYKNHGWIDWYDFLGKEKGFLTYEEAKKVIHPLKIKSIGEWKKHKFDNIPLDPSYYYKRTGEWIDWYDFLGKIGKKIRRENVLSYEEAKKIIHPLKIKSIGEWDRRKREFNNLPSRPDSFYGLTGEWIDWYDFLGKERIKKAKKKLKPRVILSYEEAKKIIHPLKIKSIGEWDRRKREFNNLPRSPYNHYKRTGEWIDWYDFLGSKKEKKIYLLYEEVKKIIHPLKIKNGNEWRKLVENDIIYKIHKDIPNNPEYHYRRTGEWIDWYDFLGKERIKKYFYKGEYRTLAEILKLSECEVSESSLYRKVRKGYSVEEAMKNDRYLNKG